jgi:hypothetical protein
MLIWALLAKIPKQGSCLEVYECGILNSITTETTTDVHTPKFDIDERLVIDLALVRATI